MIPFDMNRLNDRPNSQPAVILSVARPRHNAYRGKPDIAEYCPRQMAGLYGAALDPKSAGRGTTTTASHRSPRLGFYPLNGDRRRV